VATTRKARDIQLKSSDSTVQVAVIQPRNAKKRNVSAISAVQTLHGKRLTPVGKIMISLPDKLERALRQEIARQYHGRVGGLSIFFEKLVREYFAVKEKSPDH